MNLSDKIRALFEGINLRILNESDILRPSIIEFFESLYTITEEDIIRMNVDKVLLTIVWLFAILSILTKHKIAVNDLYKKSRFINVFIKSIKSVLSQSKFWL